MRLPDHLQPLLSEEPIFDLYAYGPWRVPDGLLEEIGERIDALVNDPRCAGLTTESHRVLKLPASLVVAELVVVLDFLYGSGAVTGGSRSNLQAELFNRFKDDPPDFSRSMTSWGCSGGRYRPPLEWLDDVPDRDLAFTLARECLDVFEGLEPLERRRQALIRMHDNRPDVDPALPMYPQRQQWAAHADEETLAELPELAGPVDYLEWICSGLIAAHSHLLAAAPRDEPVEALLANLLLQGGMTEAPAELAVAAGQDRYGEIQARLAATADGFEPRPWYEGARSWLSRALVAGEADACRAWLDMAMRFTASVQGLPDEARTPDPEWIPVGEFQTDLRRLFAARRRVANPLAAKLGTTATVQATTEKATPEFSTRLIEQPDVVAAMRRVAGTATNPVRLLLVGPDGTGKRDAAQEIAALLEKRGIGGGPLWLADDFFAGKSVSEATGWLHREAGDCAGRRLLVIDGLDDMARDPRCGEAVVEQLHRLLDVHDDLHVVALAEENGDERIREINPALLLRFHTARTRLFTAAGHAELFRRAVTQRGARVEDAAAEAAGELLAGARPIRNLRNARLAQRLADLAVEAAGDRTEPGKELVVEAADIPESFDVVEAAGDPLAELGALIGLDSVKHEIELIVADAKAARMRREAGMAIAAPARHLVFAGNPGTGKTVVARLLARIYKDLGVLSSGHLVEASRSQLVGEYLGETAVKTRRMVRQALGGVLFIDEAYSLSQSRLSEDYGKEAVAELVKAMEDHRDDLVVIVAGYEGEMADFLAANPGLESRFPRRLRFADYTDDELVAILNEYARQAGLTLGEGVEGKVRGLLRRSARGGTFGNARLIRNLFERATALQSRRVVAADGKDGLGELLAADIPDTLTDQQQDADGLGLYI